MTVLVISSICFSITLLMPMMMQPLSLGLCIMILSVVLCMLIGLVVSSWYGYVLFLVYVGGLLVMFAYVAALAPNAFFSGVGVLVWIIISFLLISMGLYILHVPNSVPMFLGDGGKESQFLLIYGGGVINPSSVSVIIVLGIILLVNLLAVVKICYYQQGPLRSYFELK